MRSGQGERAAVERLEPRILYSADMSPLASTVIGPQAAEQRVLDDNAEFAPQAEQAVQSGLHEIVFIDGRTPDYQLLVEDIAAQSGRPVEVVVLDTERSGVEQISEALTGRDDVAALHIIAHGDEGVVQLGNALLTADTLQNYRDEVEAWSRALTADADILLYGCDVAATAQGKQLADTLARLTGADVSASDDATGHASLGGDWKLEYATGAIEVPVAPSESAQQAWSHLLDTVLVAYEPPFADMTDFAYEVSGSLGSLSQSFTYTSGSGTYTVNQIDIVLYRNASPAGGNITIELRSALGGGAGQIIESGTVARRSLDTSEGWVAVSLSAPATLTDGVTYFISIKGIGGGNLFVGVDDVITGSTYAGGTFFDYTNTAVPAKDMAFRLIESNKPVVDLSGPSVGQDESVNFIEQTPRGIAQNGTITDPDSADLESLTATLTARPDGDAVESLSLNAAAAAAASGAGLTFVYTPATGVLFITDTGVPASVATYQTILRGILYNNTSDAPTETDRSVTVVANDGTTPSATRTSFVTVNAVNDAPVLVPAAPSFTSITEDQTTNAGDSVTALLGASVSDVDAAALEGMAVTGLVSGNGTWQFSINGGGSWSAVGAVAGNSALLLRDIDLLRFVPDGLNADAGSVTYRAWDRTSGTQGNKVDASVNGGSTAFSLAIDTASITVTAVNDAPTGADKTVTTNEDTAYVFSAADFGFGDVDAGDSLSAVRIDSLPGAGTLKLSGVAVSATDVIAAANIPNLTFEPGLNGNGSGYASFTFSVRDQSNAFDALPNTITVDVTAVNDAPVADLNAGGAGQDVTVAFTEQTPVLIAPAGTLADVDSANLTSLTVTLTARPDGDAVESLSLNAAATAAAGGLTASYTAATGVLSITGPASLATYQTILQGIEYNNTSDAPTTTDRSVTVVANDGALPSATQSSTLTVTAVNEAPVNTVPGGQSVDEDTVLSIVGLSVNDVDGNLATTQLSVASGTLNVSLAGGASISSGANGTGSLTLSGTQAQVNAALAALSYQGNLNFNGADTLTVLSTDSAGVPLSDTDTVALTIAAVNDAPVASAGATLAYTQKGVSAVIDSTVTLSDVDDIQLTGATVTIAAPVAGDVLAFVDQSGITGGFAGGVLTLTGSATLAEYEAALRSVTYSSSATDPTVNNTRLTRTIIWSVTDASSAAVGATSTVNLGGLAAPVGIVVIDPGLGSVPPPAASTPPPVTAPSPAPSGAGFAPTVVPGSGRVAVSSVDAAGDVAGDIGAFLADIVQRSQQVQSGSAPAGTSRSGSPTGAASAASPVGVLSAGLDIGPLAIAQAQASPVFVLEEFLRGGSRSAELVESLDRLRDEMDEKTRREQVVNGTAAAVGMSLTVGYLLWLARGGILLSSLLASLPAWRLLDPLPVLGRMSDDEDDAADDDSATPSADAAEDAADEPRETRSA